MAREEDIKILRRTAWLTGGHSRLFKDPEVQRKSAYRERMDRIENAVRSNERFVFVEGPSFLSLKMIDQGLVIIDQIAVDPRNQGKGVTTSMIGRACRALNADTIQAGTQETNPARALYKSLGMKVTRRQRTFHT